MQQWVLRITPPPQLRLKLLRLDSRHEVRVASLDVAGQLLVPPERLVAVQALVRLVNRMRQHVALVRVGPHKLLAAHVARVLALHGVDVHVLGEVVRLLEPAVAHVAHKRLLAGVHTQVPLQVAHLAELHGAAVAVEAARPGHLRLAQHVDGLVAQVVRVELEALGAHLARVRELAGVLAHVRCEQLQAHEALGALQADVRLLA